MRKLLSDVWGSAVFYTTTNQKIFLLYVSLRMGKNRKLATSIRQLASHLAMNASQVRDLLFSLRADHGFIELSTNEPSDEEEFTITVKTFRFTEREE